ncbi:acetylornithine aminotransferase [Bacillus sp. TS-2]|nr:acetylornithine aminotransferase [Bacillus sp. TS-2]
MTEWKDRDHAAIMTTYNRLPITIEKGEGSYLTDVNGTKYLDLFTGLAVNILGHSHPKIIKALKNQADHFLHISNVFLNKPAIVLAEKLVKHSIEGKVFFTNSGAEATEAAIKLVHKYSKSIEQNRNGIVVLKNSFHGRTLGAIKLTRQRGVYQDFPSTALPIYEVAPHEIEELEQIIERHQPAAVLMEPVLGSGGILPLNQTYLKEVERLCNENQVLFCMDEIQTGMGRTGTFFAYEHAEVSPDLILFAKGVGGGLPLGGLIVSDKYSDLFKPGDHGTTFAPSPLSAALGSEVIDILIEDEMLEKGKKASEKLWQELSNIKSDFPDLIEEIRGIGMMVGIVMNLEAGSVKSIQRNLLQAGILVDVTQQTIIRLLPPLTISNAEIHEFKKAFENELKSHKLSES